MKLTVLIKLRQKKLNDLSCFLDMTFIIKIKQKHKFFQPKSLINFLLVYFI